VSEPTDLDQLLALLTAAGAKSADQVLKAEMAKWTYMGGKRVRILPLPKARKDAPTTVHRVKVTLYGSKPPIWRRLDIPSATTLDLIHETMLIAFGWFGMHLHSFETPYGTFGPPDSDDFDEPTMNERKASLGQVASEAQAKVIYTYDFGDDWRHDIVIEEILPATPDVTYPRCVAGRRQAPAEDSGGISAANEENEEEPFDADEITAALADLPTSRKNRYP
jgi:hypothetical protein